MPVNGTSPFEDPLLVRELLKQMQTVCVGLTAAIQAMTEAAEQCADAWEAHVDQLTQEARSEPFSGDPWAVFPA